MIILDTNVVSEPMRSAGNPLVLDWLDRQMAETLYLTATSLSELLTGVEIVPGGRRKASMAAMLGGLLQGLFGERVLAFDEQAARAYAHVMSRARARGYSIAVADGQIAAIAQVQGFAVATRDTGPFVAAGVRVVNPWETGA